MAPSPSGLIVLEWSIALRTVDRYTLTALSAQYVTSANVGFATGGAPHPDELWSLMAWRITLLAWPKRSSQELATGTWLMC